MNYDAMSGPARDAVHDVESNSVRGPFGARRRALVHGGTRGRGPRLAAVRRVEHQHDSVSWGALTVLVASLLRAHHVTVDFSQDLGSRTWPARRLRTAAGRRVSPAGKRAYRTRRTATVARARR